MYIYFQLCCSVYPFPPNRLVFLRACVDREIIGLASPNMLMRERSTYILIQGMYAHVYVRCPDVLMYVFVWLAIACMHKYVCVHKGSRM